EWVHVQLHQQKGMISLSPPTICNSAILGIDRFMSECRALTNLIGNACATIVVARWDKALDKDVLDKALRKSKTN
ncbi:hypothetical protein ABTH53_12320, partial [Acinetobacter baumannii]